MFTNTVKQWRIQGWCEGSDPHGIFFKIYKIGLST